MMEQCKLDLWKKGIWCLIGVAWCMLSADSAASSTNAMRHRLAINLNPGWLFLAGDRAGAQSVRFDETKCETICLPHANRVVKHTSIDTSSFAFISWYRRHITPPVAYRGRRFILGFEAVSKAAEVYVNGHRMGEHCGAYTPFSFDISERIVFSGDNVIAVRVDSRQRKDIPPEGKDVDYMIFGGIVRDVSLTVVDPFHVDRVYAKKDTGAETRIAVETVLINDDNHYRRCSVATQLVDAKGKVVAQTTGSAALKAHSSKTFHWIIGPIAHAHPWHPDTPYLYTVRTVLADSAGNIDSHQFRFGLRSFVFSKTGTFTVNGNPLRLRGLNRHETFPFIGRAVSNRLQARDAEIIKYDFGCNMVRCSHYPQDPAFLDRCDEIGLLVLEEMAGWAWVTNDPSWKRIALQNLEKMILRDRNHASIVSFGVRINQSADFHHFYQATNQIARALDPSRPTHGARVLDRGSRYEFMEGIWTQNFAIPDSTPPLLPWITTESVGHWVPAHSWDNTAWLCSHARIHAVMLDSALANPAIAGILGWCAFDYNSAHQYAERSVCYHGVADIFRQPKPAAYIYQSQRDPARYGPMVYILHDWSEEIKPNDVWVASNCDSVELFVRGASLGRQAPSHYCSLPHPLFAWKKVSYRKGKIKAVGFMGGRAVATHIRATPHKPVRLVIAAEDTLLETGGDMTRVVVIAVDKNRQPVPRVSVPVTITVEGAADFLGTNPIALENGRTAFFIKTRAADIGTVRCTVKSAKLKAADMRITVRGKKETGVFR
jgi:beta-galactosidase